MPHLVLIAFLTFSFLVISVPILLLDKLWPSPPSSLKNAVYGLDSVACAFRITVLDLPPPA